MPPDARAFDGLVAAGDPAMAIVTTVAGDERAGCLVGFHSQCSIDPARYAVWLSKANHTYRVALLAEYLAVHFLATEDRALADLFGGTSGDDLDKFTRCEWTAAVGGVPVLVACPRRIVGRRETLVDDRGDHVCVVVEPLEVASSSRFAPLRLSDVSDLEPGHGNEERPRPPTERSG